MMKVDLRSDTVSIPTSEMLASIQTARLGDDILREDPTVLELEQRCADLFGKESAMLTMSGTMSNELAVMAFVRPGDEIIADSNSHLFNLETGGVAALAGAQVRTIASDNGIYDQDVLEQSIYNDDVQRANTRLICLENSYHLNRGLALSPKDYAPTIKLAKGKNIPVFLDGARIFNAACALDKSVAELSEGIDAVALCLCKGLGAPLGSMLMGSKDFIHETRRIKQRIGGGMRQAGVIAAPALYALDNMVDRLQEDQDHAAILRDHFIALGANVDCNGIMTNIVNLDVSPLGMDARTFADKLGDCDIKIKVCNPSENRMVLHHNITQESVRYIVEKSTEVLSA